MAINKTSIVIFSSGNQEHIAKQLNNMLTHIGYECVHWRSLFTIEEGRNNDVYALLPTLLKKIPTFDFSIIIAAADDISVIQRSNSIDSSRTMRDNLIFETGLSVMALGQNKTILVADERVRFIDDFIGCEGADGMMAKDYPQNLSPSQLGVKCITYCSDKLNSIKNEQDYQRITHEISEHISQQKDSFEPIVIGASCSTAVGYFDNFVIKIAKELAKSEKIFIKQKDKEGNISKEGCDISFVQNIKINILIPKIASCNKDKYYNDNDYNQMVVFQGGADDRGMSFRGKVKDTVLYVADIPTTMTTSYSTAKKLLSLEANDKSDLNDEERFVRKEIKAFDKTLRSQLDDNIADIPDNVSVSIELIDINYE